MQRVGPKTQRKDVIERPFFVLDRRLVSAGTDAMPVRGVNVKLPQFLLPGEGIIAFL